MKGALSSFLLLGVILAASCGRPTASPAATPQSTPPAQAIPAPTEAPSPTPASKTTQIQTPTPTVVSTTPTSVPTPSPSPTPKLEERREILRPIAAWWLPKWSEDGANLSVRYTRGKGTLSITIHVSRGYDPFGVPLAGDEVKEYKGEDIYGREQDVTVVVPSSWRGGLKPDSVVAYGTITYPSGVNFEQSWFAQSLRVTVNCEYDDKGYLKGGSGNQEFSGHLSTSAGTITYSGNATGTFTALYGQLGWTKRVQKTNYYGDNKPYAETVTITTAESKYLGGRLVVVREIEKTTTTYADGSQRESEVDILYQRNEHGVLSGKSASGVVTGAEVTNGKPVSYAGSIAMDYGFDSSIGWHKVAYSEKRPAADRLPERLPFEVIFIDDFYFRPVL